MGEQVRDTSRKILYATLKENEPRMWTEKEILNRRKYEKSNSNNIQYMLDTDFGKNPDEYPRHYEQTAPSISSKPSTSTEFTISTESTFSTERAGPAPNTESARPNLQQDF